MSKNRAKKPVSPEVLAKRQEIVELYNKLGGNASEVARQLGMPRSTVYRHIRKHVGKITRPVAGGTIRGITHASLKLPAEGEIKRFILTSAQNNTFVHDDVFKNLVALSEYYNAQIIIGTYSYNKNAYGALAVKRGTKEPKDKELWYDERIEKYIYDENHELGAGLLWIGKGNIIPTENNPLSGFQAYSGAKSCIFPHAKIEMRSVAALQGRGTKLMYTTGTITKRNYIQKKAGLKAEQAHAYGGLLVEVDSNGHWWVRQLEADDNTGRIQDLDLVVENGKVTTGHRVEAITWGDIHATILDPTVKELSIGKNGMLEQLRPRYQFVHDLLEGVSINHHNSKNPHDKFKAFMRGYDVVTQELKDTCDCLNEYHNAQSDIETIVVDSNHDNWLGRWLREHDYRNDPRNAILFLEAQLETYKQIAGNNESFNLTQWAMARFGANKHVKFLLGDDSFTICNHKIECGMHGHLGPDGARGTTGNLSRMGRKANTGHTHSASIMNGLYTAGTSTNLRMGYNHGPSSWGHSHILTYPNGKRTIITVFAGKWRA